MLAAALGCLLAFAPAPEPAPEPESVAGGWLSLAPLGVALPISGGSPTATHRAAVRAGYRWGFDAGASFEPVPGLLLNVSAGFSQTIWFFRNIDRGGYSLCFRGDCYGWDERGVGQLMRLGPRLRLGYAGPHLLVWAHAGAQLAISRIRLDCNNSVEDHCARSETDLGPALGGGLGIAARLTPHVGIGLEAGVEHAWLDPRDDPFRAIRSFDLALLVILRF